MEKSTFNTSENEKFTTIGNAKLSPELIEELAELQANNNSPINFDIEQIDEVIGFLTDIHTLGEEVICPEKILDSIASLRWIISRYKIFKAPPVGA